MDLSVQTPCSARKSLRAKDHDPVWEDDISLCSEEPMLTPEPGDEMELTATLFPGKCEPQEPGALRRPDLEAPYLDLL